MKEAAFKLIEYKFNHVMLDMTAIDTKEPLGLNLIPSGCFISSQKSFELDFLFTADSAGKRVVKVNCKASFVFNDVEALEDIPAFFYSNSIAIVFPYVRAFISTLTLQANYSPIVLPTMNLSDLNEMLKRNVTTE